MRELQNPWSNAHIARDGATVDPRAYHKHSTPRGMLGYTMTRSDLVEFDHNPRRWRNGFEKKSDAFGFGRLVDVLALTPNNFERVYALQPESYVASDGKTKDWTRKSNTCRDWEEAKQAEGIEIITPADYAKGTAAVKALHDNPSIHDLLELSETQVILTADYRDEDTGLTIPFKFMLDLVPEMNSVYGKCLADLKTTVSADPYFWRTQVRDYRLHVQAAMYLDAYVAATGEDRNTFYHPLVENYAPYETACRQLSLEFVEWGRVVYHTALKRYARCLATNQWPGYDDPERTKNIFAGWTLVEPEEHWMARA